MYDLFSQFKVPNFEWLLSYIGSKVLKFDSAFPSSSASCHRTHSLQPFPCALEAIVKKRVTRHLCGRLRSFFGRFSLLGSGPQNHPLIEIMGSSDLRWGNGVKSPFRLSYRHWFCEES